MSLQMSLELLGQRVLIEASEAPWIEAVKRGFEPVAAQAPRRRPDLHIRLQAAGAKGPRVGWTVTTRPTSVFERPPTDPSMLIAGLNRWAVEATRRHYVFHAT